MEKIKKVAAVRLVQTMAQSAISTTCACQLATSAPRATRLQKLRALKSGVLVQLPKARWLAAPWLEVIDELLDAFYNDQGVSGK